MISCQCEASHDPIHVFDISGNHKLIDKYTEKDLLAAGITSYKFLDIECLATDRQYISWESVPDNSVDAIYMMNCPIYNQLRDSVARIPPLALIIWKNLMNDAWRILRPGGMIIIPPIIGGPYPKRNKNGKVILGPNRAYVQIKVDDEAEYQRENAAKILVRLSKEHNINVPDWLLSTAKTDDLPFRVTILDDKDKEQSRILPTKHIVFTKAFNGGSKRISKTKQNQNKTRKNDRRGRKTKRSRR